ncbi:glycoside hydrolase family 31 protein [Edaphobacter dinghuensis]|uniref:Alpha-glucosidase n=1 Tax=Edaphobacter dinghuensis TaxID=1560005 RepID=A0A917H697_9BACT|nr:TIM-barrel domain-containing protein [Edaphobacter dinghuensis]GGG68557.1 alpha-glucosidase [Edaphobacter dinghuensis]
MRRSNFLCAIMAATFFTQAVTILYGQTITPSGLFQFNHATAFSSLPDGIEISDGPAHEVITALRDDVLRVRMTRQGAMSENASWAVLTEARKSSVATTPDINAEHYGFRTHSLIVEVDKKSLCLTVRDLEGNILQQDVRPAQFDGTAFRVFKTMPLDEHYFGLGDKTGPLDRREEAFALWNTDAYRFQESTDPLYKSIPFFLTYKAGVTLGVLLDNTWRTSFDFGKELPNIYSFGAVNGPLNYYILYGPSPKQVVESYAWLTGKPPLPPRWTLGFQQSRYSYESQARVMEIANHLRADHIPADAIYLDIGFQEKNRPFTVDQKRFPDFSGMIAQLKAKNFHVVAITDLHIANLPNAGYAPYDSGIAGDHFVKNPDGSVYTGVVWPGPSVFPDFTRQQTRAWWGTLYRNFQHDGIEGFWNDMNEPSIFDSPTKTMPVDVIHRIDEPGFLKRTATHAEIHDVYGMENSRATFDGLLALAPNVRPFVLTRATYAGGQRYAATWTGDNSSTWNHLRLTTPMLKNLGLSGFAFAGADVGGYAGTPPPDLLTKWLEVAAFQPIDRDHTESGTGDQEPWVGGPQQEAIRRRFIEERYRLMPYLYTLAEESSRTGLPMVRPLFLEFPDAAPDHHPLDIDLPASGEFLLGPDLLIAPSPWPEQLDHYLAEFPAEDWYDYWTGRQVLEDGGAGNAGQSPLTLNLQPELASLPVFVRGGAILPMEPLVQSTNETPRGPLTLRVYYGGPGKQCAGSLYTDDGKTYAYRKGEFLRMQFTCKVDDKGFHLHVSAHEGSYPAWWKEISAEVYGWSPKTKQISLNGRSEGQTALKSLPHGVDVVFADDGKGDDLLIR